MIHFTDSALDVLRQHLPELPNAGFRLLIQKCCSSLQYTLKHESEMWPDDKTFELEDGIKLFVDAQTLPVVDDTRVDFIQNGVQSGFTFDNPNVIKPSCSSCESTC